MESKPDCRQKIARSVTASLWHYLELQLQRYPVGRHQWVKEQFSEITGRITEHLYTDFFLSEQITAQAIKTLHALQYPEGYKGYQNDSHGNPVLYLIPGEYKLYPNHFTESGGMVKPVDTTPQSVSLEVEKLLERLNLALCGPAEQHRDAIVWFCLDISAVHPFADANGRIVVQMLDTLLVRGGYEPLYINQYKQRDAAGLYQAVELCRNRRELQPVYKYLENNKEYLEPVYSLPISSEG